MPAATATAEPLLEPQGVRSRTCGFLVWRPRPLHPLAERLERKLAHSLRLALPRMTAPASLSRVTSGASAGAGAPVMASEPAVVSMRSPVSMLSLSSTGMPWSGPRLLGSASSWSAIVSASGFSSITARSCGP